MRPTLGPIFWLLLIVGEVVAYVVTCVVCIAAGLILIGGLHLPEGPWWLPIPIGTFAWLSYMNYKFARRFIGKLAEPRGFEVLVPPDRAE